MIGRWRVEWIAESRPRGWAVLEDGAGPQGTAGLVAMFEVEEDAREAAEAVNARRDGRNLPPVTWEPPVRIARAALGHEFLVSDVRGQLVVRQNMDGHAVYVGAIEELEDNTGALYRAIDSNGHPVGAWTNIRSAAGSLLRHVTTRRAERELEVR